MSEPSENARAAWEQSGHKMGEAERLLAEGLYRQLIYGHSELSWIGLILRAFAVHRELIDIDDREALMATIGDGRRRNPLSDLGDVATLVRK